MAVGFRLFQLDHNRQPLPEAVSVALPAPRLPLTD
jgi:hypothetical protein